MPNETNETMAMLRALAREQGIENETAEALSDLRVLFLTAEVFASETEPCVGERVTVVIPRRKAIF